MGVDTKVDKQSMLVIGACILFRHIAWQAQGQQVVFPAELAKLVKADIAKYAKIIKTANIRLEQ